MTNMNSESTWCFPSFFFLIELGNFNIIFCELSPSLYIHKLFEWIFSKPAHQIKQKTRSCSCRFLFSCILDQRKLTSQPPSPSSFSYLLSLPPRGLIKRDSLITIQTLCISTCHSSPASLHSQVSLLNM